MQGHIHCERHEQSGQYAGAYFCQEEHAPMAARYRDIADDLRRRITSGEYRTGTSLPPQTVLATSYETTRTVISEAVRVLEGEGLVRPVRRRGTVVQWPAIRRRIDRGTKVTRDVRYAAADVA